jgi:hypothetical protein
MVNTAHTKTTQPHHHHHQPQRATAHTDPTVPISVMQTPHQLRTVKLHPSRSQLSVSILQLSFSLLKYESGAVADTSLRWHLWPVRQIHRLPHHICLLRQLQACHLEVL